MAAQTSFKLEEEELSCPICFEEFNLNDNNRHPKLLLCLHTFCLACMETLRKYDGSLQCSICRTSHQVYRVCDLMDNYVIFDHLKFKQEFEDERLAVQLREEYEESMRAIQEQEERDAQFAREEDEKHKAEEVERLRRVEELKKLELEKQELERLERLRLEAQREEERLKIEAQRQEERLQLEAQRQEERLQLEAQRQEERLKMEAEEQERLEQIRKREEEEEKQRVEQRNNEEPYLQIRVNVNEVDSCEERESSSDSTDSQSDDEESGSDTEDDESFQDLESGQTDEEESPTSVVDEYETLSSDTDRYSVEVISSDEEENKEEGETALSTTPAQSYPKSDPSQERSRSASPAEPDLLSEEFSGVAQPNNATKPHDNLSKLLPSVKCKELHDGTILILDTSTEVQGESDHEAKSSAEVSNVVRPITRMYKRSQSAQKVDSDSDQESRNLSSSEESLTTRARNGISSTAPMHVENDENCKLQ